MSTSGKGTLSPNFRADLIFAAVEQAIPGDLDPSEQRLALNATMSLLHRRNEALVVDKVVSDSFSDIPVIDRGEGLNN